MQNEDTKTLLSYTFDGFKQLVTDLVTSTLYFHLLETTSAHWVHFCTYVYVYLTIMLMYIISYHYQPDASAPVSHAGYSSMR